MVLFQLICHLAFLSNATVCRQLAMKNTTMATTTTTSRPLNISNLNNPLAPSRLESIKNSFSELNLLSKTKPSDFIFDFGNATTGVSNGTGGHTVAATVSTSDSKGFLRLKLSSCSG